MNPLRIINRTTKHIQKIKHDPELGRCSILAKRQWVYISCSAKYKVDRFEEKNDLAKVLENDQSRFIFERIQNNHLHVRILITVYILNIFLNKTY